MRRRATRARATDDGSLNLAKTAGCDRYPRQHASASPSVCVSTESDDVPERGPARGRVATATRGVTRTLQRRTRDD